MRKIITTTFITLDGVMQAPGGPEEGFAYGGWEMSFQSDEMMDSIMNGVMSSPFELLLSAVAACSCFSASRRACRASKAAGSAGRAEARFRTFPPARPAGPSLPRRQTTARRGHGETEWATDYGWERWIEDIDAFTRVIGRENLSLVGHSMEYGLIKRPDGRWTYRYDTVLRSPTSPRRYPDEAISWDLLSKVIRPTLIVRAAESEFMTRQNADRMLGVLAQAQAVEVADTGHMICWENPGGLITAVRSFLLNSSI